MSKKTIGNKSVHENYIDDNNKRWIDNEREGLFEIGEDGKRLKL